MIRIYARVSTRGKDQDPDVQLLPLRRWAFDAFDGVGTAFEEYVDLASAEDYSRRTAWAALMREAQAGDIVAVLRLDRAFRSTVMLLSTLEELERRRIRFVAITQPIDTGSSMGRLTLSILGAVAEFEREIIRERTREGMAKARAEGRMPGRPKGRKDSPTSPRQRRLRRRLAESRKKGGSEGPAAPLLESKAQSGA